MPSMDTLTPAELADILAFHAEAGVDCALDEVVHDRFAAQPPRGLATDETKAAGDQAAQPRALIHTQLAATEPARPAIAGAALSADEDRKSVV